METQVKIKHVRMSPLKLRTILHEIKPLSPQIALDYLSVAHSRTAKIMHKAIKAAIDSGKSKFNLDPSKARFKTITIDQGVALKRFRAGSRGSAKGYKRRQSHITIVLEQKNAKKVAPKKAKSKKETPSKEAKSKTKVESKKLEVAQKETKRAAKKADKKK